MARAEPEVVSVWLGLLVTLGELEGEAVTLGLTVVLPLVVPLALSLALRLK